MQMRMSERMWVHDISVEKIRVAPELVFQLRVTKSFCTDPCRWQRYDSEMTYRDIYRQYG